MRFIDLTVPLGVATPPWPTYEPLQIKYFKIRAIKLIVYIYPIRNFRYIKKDPHKIRR